ncbi:hypothetical protein U1Q18_041128 [Sarracenia purpurea var. burkii]
MGRTPGRCPQAPGMLDWVHTGRTSPAVGWVFLSSWWECLIYIRSYRRATVMMLGGFSVMCVWVLKVCLVSGCYQSHVLFLGHMKALGLGSAEISSAGFCLCFGWLLGCSSRRPCPVGLYSLPVSLLTSERLFSKPPLRKAFGGWASKMGVFANLCCYADETKVEKQ